MAVVKDVLNRFTIFEGTVRKASLKMSLDILSIHEALLILISIHKFN